MMLNEPDYDEEEKPAHLSSTLVQSAHARTCSFDEDIIRQADKIVASPTSPIERRPMSEIDHSTPVRYICECC